MTMAAPSSSSTCQWTYDVFLSFRGEDTRTNFVDHLYTALNDRGIYTFKDDQKLERGKSVAPELLKAIEESRFAIIVFSRNYADSSWCLDELVKIVDCKNSIGQTILPVFYDVDPSEVRKQTGCIGEAFAKHGINGGKDEYQIQRWRNALAEAASVSGWDLPNTANGHESQCIKQIVGNVLLNLENVTSSIFAEHLIGMEPRVQDVKSLLLKGSNEVNMVGILGMGGMGKTTLARAVFDDISNQFEGRSFVENVREVFKSGGLQSLQGKILSQILLKRNIEICSVQEGISMMSHLCHRRVLLVLDDVDHEDQLEALVGNRDWFGKGSRIIITTRNRHLLVVHGVNEIYRAVLLNDHEALSLFNRHAFKGNSPPKEYVEPSNLLVRNVGGLPLALKVLGSFLYGRTMVEWEGVVNKLMKHEANKRIVGVLKISFDGLEHNEQEIFLDIACFFLGEKKDNVSEILDIFDFYPNIGLSVLIEKCLLNVSNGNLQMHDMIKELAWDIVKQMDLKEPGRRSRLWLREDVHDVLTNDMGTEAIEGIKLQKTKINYSFRALRNMKKLRLLDVSHYDRYRQFKGPGPEHLSNELRWIRWRGYPSKSLPPSFRAEKLVSLRLHRSNIVQLWEGRKILDKLKLVDLTEAYHLIKTPDFSGAPNLEKLILCECRNLKEVHPSLGDLQRLTFLNLIGCSKLERFLSSINMTSLEILILTNCTKLKVFPKILGDMDRLTELYLDGTAIKEVHPSIGKLTGLVILDLTRCENLWCLPRTIGCLKGLKTLRLDYCSRLEELPETLGQMECLEELHLNDTAITQQQSSIVLHKDLRTLSFGCYDKPASLLRSFFSSRGKSPYPYHSMDSWLWQKLSGFPSLKKLEIVYCNLSEIPSNISQLSALEELRLRGNAFTCLPDSLCQISRLKVLDLRDCLKLKALAKLPSSIAMLVMDNCVSLESLGDLITTKHDWLHDISFQNCFKLIKNEEYSGSSSSGLADLLLTTMLQGQSVIKHHQFHIFVPGRQISNRILLQHKETLQLKLLPDWDRRIAGFMMSSVDFRPDLVVITLGHKYEKMLTHSRRDWHQSELDHVWVGYVSLDFFGKIIFGDKYKKGCDWVGGTETSFLKIEFLKPSYSNGIFGINVVYKKDVKHIIYNEEEEEDHNSSSADYVNNLGFYHEEADSD